ncbi:hypothetical protein ON010_g13565 [Phytophthora cinnamomi]|nr:hypothetical protein ON010_g13565 [Phytophthora cinnamomi]
MAVRRAKETSASECIDAKTISTSPRKQNLESVLPSRVAALSHVVEMIDFLAATLEELALGPEQILKRAAESEQVNILEAEYCWSKRGSFLQRLLSIAAAKGRRRQRPPQTWALLQPYPSRRHEPDSQ